MTAITTTNGTSSSEEIITEMQAYQKEHSTQMKRLETLFSALSSATTTTTATPSTPVPVNVSGEKSTANLQKLQEDVGDTHEWRVHGVRGESHQTMTKLEEQTQIGYNRALIKKIWCNFVVKIE